MKQILLMIAVGAGQSVLAADKKLITAPILEQAIRRELKKPAGDLTKADLKKVTRLNLMYNRLTELPTGLEKLTHLKTLVLTGNKLTSVKGLEKLTQLTRLYLGGNQLTEVPKELEKLTQLTRLELYSNHLTDVKGLDKLTQLEWVALYKNPDLTLAQIIKLRKTLPNCEILSDHPLTKEESAEIIEAAIRKKIKKPTGELTKADLEKVTRLNLGGKRGKQLTDVTALEKLTQLKELHLDSNKLAEVSKGLEKLTKLRELYLNNNQLTDVKGLEKFTQLTKLYLSGNQLTDVKGLEKLTKLETLHLWSNKLTNVKGLEKLTQLKSLALRGNQLTDVKGLEKLTQLEALSLTYNPDLTKAQIAELQKALPKCEIRSNPTK